MEPLFGPGRPPNLNTIRIGTKSLAWWPRRYLTDVDSSAVLKLFADIVASGTHLTIQAHFSHPREVEDPRTQEAVRLIRMTGAQIRSQAPLIKRINDNAEVWESMWKTQTKLGIIPYYMFMERDTGAQHYFSVPLARAHGIFRQAISRLPGTARTARGPSMSASPGKICVLGDVHIRGEHCFALQFLQSRNPDWNGRIFFARFDPTAIWFDDLKPAFGEEKFFFERQYQKQKDNYSNKSSGQLCNADWDLLQ
jgi:L-lysine 2,3-aminomutase